MVVPQPRIFLSHSSKDHEFCVRLVEDLRRVLGDDDAVWYDARGGLQSGDAWWSKIERELDTRTIFLVVLSPDAVTSAWVNDEIDIAWRRKNHPDPASRMRFIPLLYRSCTIRPGLESLQVVSFLPPKSYEIALQEILTALGLPSQPVDNQKPPSAPRNYPVANVGSQLTTAPQLRPLTARFEAIEVLHTLIAAHKVWVTGVALSADGLLLASGGGEQAIKLWNTQTGQFLRALEGHTFFGTGFLGGVDRVTLSADGLLLASSGNDDRIKLWNTQTGQLLHTLKGYGEALSANGLLLASKRLHNDRTINLWNTQTGQLLRTLTGHRGSVKSVALSADGLLLASGSDDRIINLWGVKE